MEALAKRSEKPLTDANLRVEAGFAGRKGHLMVTSPSNLATEKQLLYEQLLDAERELIFDPTRLTDGIVLSDDPLPLVRSAIYAISYTRRNT